MKIKVLEKTSGCFPQKFDVGDWFDLCLAETVKLKAPTVYNLDVVNFQSCLVPLGVCMEIPKGFEAIVVPRSSTFKKYGILQSNSVGVIDGSFSSDKDEWKMPMVATRSVVIPKGTRVAQFRIQLSQKATSCQKLKWLVSSNVKLMKVDTLDNPERGGFGSTGEK